MCHCCHSLSAKMTFFSSLTLCLSMSACNILMKSRLVDVLLFKMSMRLTGSGVKSKVLSLNVKRLDVVFNIPVPDSGVVMDSPGYWSVVYSA